MSWSYNLCKGVANVVLVLFMLGNILLFTFLKSLRLKLIWISVLIFFFIIYTLISFFLNRSFVLATLLVSISSSCVNRHKLSLILINLCYYFPLFLVYRTSVYAGGCICSTGHAGRQCRKVKSCEYKSCLFFVF